MGLTSTYLSILAMASVAVAQNCTLAIDARVPAGSTPAFFDSNASPFSTQFVKGQNLNWSDIIKIPKVPESLFDAPKKTIAYEVTISNRSIFASSLTNIQTGFRRAEVQFKSNNGSDPSTTGIKTLHFSVRKDPARLLNLSHEYQLVFLEDAKFASNQFILKTGFLFDQPAGSDPDSLVLVGNTNQPLQTLFNTSFTPDVFHNFGITLDFTKNKTTVLYSTGSNPLAVVKGPVDNDISGRGQFHVGILKKPTGQGLKDVTKEGFQSPDVNEGVIYAGVFMEDSTGGCVSLHAGKSSSAKSSKKNGGNKGGNKKGSKPHEPSSGKNVTSKPEY